MISSIQSTSMSIPSTNMSIPSMNMSVPSTNMSIPPRNMSVPSTNMSTPPRNISIPSTSMSIPSTSMSIPSTSMSIPSTSMTIPSTSMTIPSTSMTIPSTSMTIPKQKRLRFREEDDLIFLREVLGYNPFQQADLWSVIQEHIHAATKKLFSVKTLRDHLDLLIKIWLEKTKKYQDRSGIEEPYTEKDKLLQEIYSLMVEFRVPSKKNQKQAGIAARDHWAKENYASAMLVHHVEDVVSCDEACNPVVSVEKSLILDHEYTKKDDPQSETCGTLKRPLEESLTFAENMNRSDVGGAETPTGPPRGKYNVFSRNKSRARKSSAQKQGLAIVQEHDRSQKEIKHKELDLRKKELELQEKKLEIEKRRIDLDERREELKQRTTQKVMETVETAMSLFTRVVDNQEKLIHFILAEKK